MRWRQHFKQFENSDHTVRRKGGSFKTARSLLVVHRRHLSTGGTTAHETEQRKENESVSIWFSLRASLEL